MAANHTFTLGPAGQEIDLADTTKYIFPPDGFRWTPVRREIYRERRTGGSDLSYSREMRLDGKLSLIIVAPGGSYDAALTNYNALNTMFENARQYWRHKKDSPSAWLPVIYTEKFYNQVTSTVFTVLTGDLPINTRLLLPGGAIQTDMAITVDAPTGDNNIT